MIPQYLLLVVMELYLRVMFLLSPMMMLYSGSFLYFLHLKNSPPARLSGPVAASDLHTRFLQEETVFTQLIPEPRGEAISLTTLAYTSIMIKRHSGCQRRLYSLGDLFVFLGNKVTIICGYIVHSTLCVY